MKIYYTYDNRGFYVAKEESGEELTTSDLKNILDDCDHDFNKGFCQSYQIFCQYGLLIMHRGKNE